MASVTKRKWTTKSGKEKVAWAYSFYDPVTKKQYKKSGFKTKLEAEDELRKEQNRLKSGEKLNVNLKMTFDELAIQYIEYHCKIYCKPSTNSGYQNYLDAHILPFFKGMKLIEITPQSISRFINEKQSENLKPKSINNLLVLIKAILNYGVKNELIQKNPAEHTKKLSIPHKEMEFLNIEEINLVLENCNEKFYAFLYTAIFTGMRKGEQLALNWKDIDFKSKKIRVNKSLYKKQVVEPKTKTSIRKIDMTDSHVLILQEHKRKHTIFSELVFPSQAGTFMDPDNFIKRQYEPLLKGCGLRHIRWHDLRHTYASLLISQNIPIKYIQSQMGHSSIQVTLDRYGHLMPDVHDNAVNALENILRTNSNENILRTY